MLVFQIELTHGCRMRNTTHSEHRNLGCKALQ